MSATTYIPSDLLIGKAYYSQHRYNKSGIIQEAIHAPELWYDNAEAYRVRVRPTYQMGHLHQEDFWATVCVSKD
jgi:hypothetical protein